MQRLLITITAAIATLLCYAQTPITQIEGFLEVSDARDISSTYIGYSAGQNTILSLDTPALSNTFVGFQAGLTNTTGSSNSFYGVNAGLSNMKGELNNFFGRNSGFSNTSGEFNSFFGTNSGFFNTIGDSNCFFGNNSGQSNTEGFFNSFFGRSAGRMNLSGSENSFFGTASGGKNTTGFSNSFFGRSSGQSNTAGKENSFFGYNAGFNNTTGSENSFFGRSAGENITKQTQMIVIGANAGPTLPTPPDSMRLYIDVEKRNDPLIYGEFDNNILRINGELHLGPNDIPEGSGGDEGIIRSPQPNGSDIFMIANDAIVMQIGEVNSESGAFEIKNGGNDELLLGIDESGDLRIKGSYNMISDRHAKKNFQTIDHQAILSKIADLPITKWNYKNSTDQHIGPMAQDFYAAFGLGQGETTIATVDADGVALVAIQALAKENQDLKSRVENLENLIVTLLEEDK